jgi:hypothetical protein
MLHHKTWSVFGSAVPRLYYLFLSTLPLPLCTSTHEAEELDMDPLKT